MSFPLQYATPTYDLGDTAQFDLTLTARVGNTIVPVEATDVTLEIIAPDGISVTIPLAGLIHTGGQNTYAYRKSVDQVGTWQTFWHATGTYNSQPFTQNEPDQVYVRKRGPRIISLAEAKAVLHMPAGPSQDDPRIRGLIDAAAEQVEFYCGPVLPLEVTLNYAVLYSVGSFPRSGWVLLDPWPVAHVKTLSGVAATAADIKLTQEGYAWIPAGATELTYVAGRDPVPQTLREAAQELVAHWWQGSSQFSMASPTQVLPSDDYDARSVLPGQAYGVPFRALDKMRPHLRVRVA